VGLCSAAKGEWAPVHDPLRSMADDVSKFPTSTAEAMAGGLQTAFRTERLRDMTYTQFLILLREGYVERVKYSDNMKSMRVTTTADCPGRGRVTEEIGLIYDPTLYTTLCSHGVAIEYRTASGMEGVQAGLMRIIGPMLLTTMVIGWSLTLGRKPDDKHPLFGGARMELVKSSDVRTTFADVAGIDAIKAEIMEVVSFLKDQVRLQLPHPADRRLVRYFAAVGMHVHMIVRVPRMRWHLCTWQSVHAHPDICSYMSTLC
jgi:ATP-dependent Zn protease